MSGVRLAGLVLIGLLLTAAAAGARTIVGTAGNDRLVGTPRADTIAGRAGNDRISGFAGGFSLGNFTFLTAPALQDAFLAPGLSSHETGHTLNTAAFSGVVLWINAVDENIPPFRKMNVAYGELTAESHAQALPAPPTRVRFFVNLWG